MMREKIVDCLIDSFIKGNKICDYGLREEFRGKGNNNFYEIVSENYTNLAKLFTERLRGKRINGMVPIVWTSDFKNPGSHCSVNLDYYIERYRAMSKESP